MPRVIAAPGFAFSQTENRVSVSCPDPRCPFPDPPRSSLMRPAPRFSKLCVQLIALSVAFAGPAVAATPRFTIYVSRLDPSDANARDFAKPGYGGGVDLSWPLGGTQGMLAVIGGVEASSLLSKEKTFQDQLTG